MLKLIVNDLLGKPWAPGTTAEVKNKYRRKIIAIMGALMAAFGTAGVIVGPIMFGPIVVCALVALRKYTIIRKSEQSE